MAAKNKKGADEHEAKSAKSTSKSEKPSRSIKAQKPEKLEKDEKARKAHKAESAEKAPKKERTPARKLAGSDTGAEAAAAESRDTMRRKVADTHKTAHARSAHAREYRPQDKYKVGETIYHPFWKEEGKVIEVGKTAGNTDQIVVEFSRLGLKRLVVNYAPVQATE